MGKVPPVYNLAAFILAVMMLGSISLTLALLQPVMIIILSNLLMELLFIKSVTLFRFVNCNFIKDNNEAPIFHYSGLLKDLNCKYFFTYIIKGS